MPEVVVTKKAEDLMFSSGFVKEKALILCEKALQGTRKKTSRVFVKSITRSLLYSVTII